MEITEVVTPSVAIPVLGVLVCAFLVFAFGFKSPGQPPSFDAFDEENKKKKTKRSKVSITSMFRLLIIFVKEMLLSRDIYANAVTHRSIESQ